MRYEITKREFPINHILWNVVFLFEVPFVRELLNQNCWLNNVELYYRWDILFSTFFGIFPNRISLDLR